MLSGSSRTWERWDDPGLARHIDQHWRRQPSEGHHRCLLAELVARYAAPGSRLLEVGCGSGYFYEHLDTRRRDLVYTGVDTSSEMLSLARTRFPQGVFLEGDAFTLAFPDNAFDLVVAFEVLGHLPDIAVPLREMHRVCSHRLLFTVWEGDEVRDVGESLEGSHFIHREYTRAAVLDVLARIGISSTNVECSSVSGAVQAYAVPKRVPPEAL